VEPTRVQFSASSLDEELLIMSNDFKIWGIVLIALPKDTTSELAASCSNAIPWFFVWGWLILHLQWVTYQPSTLPSKDVSPCIHFGEWQRGHKVMMWSAVCSNAPQLHFPFCWTSSRETMNTGTNFIILLVWRDKGIKSKSTDYGAKAATLYQRAGSNQWYGSC